MLNESLIQQAIARRQNGNVPMDTGEMGPGAPATPAVPAGQPPVPAPTGTPETPQGVIDDKTKMIVSVLIQKLTQLLVSPASTGAAPPAPTAPIPPPAGTPPAGTPAPPMM